MGSVAVSGDGAGEPAKTESGTAAGDATTVLEHAAEATPAAREKPDRKDAPTQSPAIRLAATATSVSGRVATREAVSAVVARFHALRRVLADARAAGKALPASLVVVLRVDAAGTSVTLEGLPADVDPVLKAALEKALSGLEVAGPGTARIRVELSIVK
jgi:hypothetical protein